MNEIFTVTVLEDLTPCGHKRVVGWYPKLEEAVTAVKVNDLDMQEVSYRYAVIEKVQPYTYGSGKPLIWFKWNKKRWHKIKSPKEFKNIVNISIG